MMKKLLIVLAMMLIPAAVWGDLDSTDWAASIDGVSAENSITHFRSGTYSMRVSNTHASLVGGFWQDIPFVGGATYKVDVYAYVESGTAKLLVKSILSSGTLASWTLLSIEETACAGLRVHLYVTPGGVAWFDDFTVTELATRAQNEQTYNDKLKTDPSDLESNSYFAALYEFVDEDMAKAVPHLVAMDTWQAWKRLADYYLHDGVHVKAAEAYETAASRAIEVNAPVSVLKELGQKLEGVKMILGE